MDPADTMAPTHDRASDISGRPPTVSVCVPTRGCLDSLARLLSALVRLKNLGDIEVIVVENGPDPRCGSLVNRTGGDFPPGRLTYLHLAIPNVAAARNAAVTIAVGKWLAFIDDDEVPDREWLASMVGVAERFGADGVLGPIVPEYPPSTPRWIVECGVFRRARFETGVRVPAGHLRTGNLLLRRALCHPDAVWFDEAFGATGGEDTEFLGRLASRGAAFIWCEEALVAEHLEARNLSARAVTLRAVGAGQSYARHVFRRFGLIGRLWIMVAGLGGLVVRGIAGSFCVAVDRTRGINMLLRAAGDIGKVTAIVGVRYERFRGRWRWAESA